MDLLKRFSFDINNVSKTHSVKSLYVFDLVTTKAFNQESDVELIVEFSTIQVETYTDNYFDLKFSLEKILNRNINPPKTQVIKNQTFINSINKYKGLVYGLR